MLLVHKKWLEHRKFFFVRLNIISMLLCISLPAFNVSSIASFHMVLGSKLFIGKAREVGDVSKHVTHFSMKKLEIDILAVQ